MSEETRKSKGSVRRMKRKLLFIRNPLVISIVLTTIIALTFGLIFVIIGAIIGDFESKSLAISCMIIITLTAIITMIFSVRSIIKEKKGADETNE